MLLILPELNRQALVPYSAALMYEIVNSVDLYYEFLPWCSESTIVESTDNSMIASVFMKKGPLNQSFTTKNTMLINQTIDLTLVDGPFKKLIGQWSFIDISDQGSKISLYLNYEFSNSIIAVVVGPIFNQIANTLVDSFCKRAEDLYD